MRQVKTLATGSTLFPHGSETKNLATVGISAAFGRSAATP